MMNTIAATEVNGMKMAGNLKLVYEMIPLGIDNPIPARQIMETVGVSRRNLAEMIQSLIYFYNVPVVAFRQKNKFGYAIATNNEELQRGIKSLQNNNNQMQHRIDKLQSIKFQEEG